MAVNVKKIGALSRSDMLWFDPDELILVTDKESPLYDERVDIKVSREFINNIKAYGVLEPVIGRFNSETGKTEIVDGRQRVNAARIAKKEQTEAGEVVIRVPVIMRRSEDTEVMGIMVSANEQRREDTVRVRAKKANRMNQMGMTIKEIANAFGVTQQTISNWLGSIGAKKKKDKERKHPSTIRPTRRLIKNKMKDFEATEKQLCEFDKGYLKALRWVLGK